MTYCSGITRHQPRHTNFKRIHCDSEETKPCRVENDTKTIISEFLSQASMGLILVFTQLCLSKTRVGYVTFNNNDFAALWDCYKVFRLNTKNFLDNFSFIANWEWNFSSFFYSKQNFLAPNSIILIGAMVFKNWQCL